MKCPVCWSACDELRSLKPFNDSEVCGGCLEQVEQGIETVLDVRKRYVRPSGNAQYPA